MKDRFANIRKTLSIFHFPFSIFFCLLSFVLCLFWTGCREYHVSDDPSLRLSFSTDTLLFDTVFTEQGSATAQLLVYNRNAEAVRIDRVWLDSATCFRINLNGEQDLSRLSDLVIYGGDSLFVFVRVDINPSGSNSALLRSDRLHFHLASGNDQTVCLQAYGQDVTRVRGKKGRLDIAGDYTFTSVRPYLVFDTLVVGGTLTFDAGARLYMHKGACIYALGDVAANGTLDQPVIISGDRLDNLFDSVPYRFAAGSWNGLYLQADQPRLWSFSYVDILSGNVGLYCYSNQTSMLPTLTMDGCRIHNHAMYGLVLINTNALVSNSEFSNCAGYCIYCDGGTHTFVHSTVASYFGYTNIRIQSTAKEDAAAVYIDNLSKQQPQTVCSFYNSIITGYRTNQLVVATPFDQYYPGVFLGNYLKTDTLQIPHAESNTYWQKSDTAEVFRNTFYKYKEYIYYDFRLDSLSPAIGIGDSLTALSYPLDRVAVSRLNCSPDAGCYQHTND